jgi:hypothetical protein
VVAAPHDRALARMDSVRSTRLWHRRSDRASACRVRDGADRACQPQARSRLRRVEAGEPTFRQLEPDRRLAAADRSAPGRSVKPARVALDCHAVVSQTGVTMRTIAALLLCIGTIAAAAEAQTSISTVASQTVRRSRSSVPEQDRFARTQTFDRQPARDIAAFHVAHFLKGRSTTRWIPPPGVRRVPLQPAADVQKGTRHWWPGLHHGGRPGRDLEAQ